MESRFQFSIENYIPYFLIHPRLSWVLDLWVPYLVYSWVHNLFSIEYLWVLCFIDWNITFFKYISFHVLFLYVYRFTCSFSYILFFCFHEYFYWVIDEFRSFSIRFRFEKRGTTTHKQNTYFGQVTGFIC
jgi:hypothetical protein